MARDEAKSREILQLRDRIKELEKEVQTQKNNGLSALDEVLSDLHLFFSYEAGGHRWRKPSRGIFEAKAVFYHTQSPSRRARSPSR